MRIEHWRFTVPLRLRSILRGRRVEHEMDEELQFHLEHKIEEGIASGLTPEDARYAALRAMDGLAQRKEEMRDARRVHWLTDCVDDVRYAIRSLRRTPGQTALLVMTLALGIGMTTTPFSMVDALIFRPYPVADPGGVVSLVSTTRDNGFGTFSYREYLDIRGRTKSYDGVIAYAAAQAVGFSADVRATPRIKAGMMVSGNYFDVLGVTPQLGRGFRDDEDRVPGRDAVVVLGPTFWEQEFAGDRSIVGRTIRLNGTDFTVIGVAPHSFPGLAIFGGPDFYMPLAMARLFSTNPERNFFEDRAAREVSVKARLKADTTLEQARSELAAIAQEFARAYPPLNRDRGAAVRTAFEMRTQGDDPNWKFSVIFATLAVAVLLVACTNAAGLLLGRARTRTREIATRLALGAGRSRLIRLLMTESLMLACLGGLGGIAVGYIGLTLLRTFVIPTELPITLPFRMDMRVLFASVVVSVLSALACGLAPALQSTRANLVNGLKASDVDMPRRHAGRRVGRRFSGAIPHLWGRNSLVMAQVAMSLMLLTAAFLMSRSFQRLVLGGTGFATDHLLMARFDPSLVQYDAARTERFYTLLTERVRSAPAVQSAALTHTPPLALDDFDRIAFVPGGVEMPRDRAAFTSAMDTIDEGYFETLGIPIVRGRGFLPSDTGDAPRVAIVNQSFANHYWPNAEAVGQHLRLDSPTGTPVEVVGVAQSIKYGAGDPTIDFVYLPLAQHRVTRMVLLMKSAGDPLQLVDTLKDVVRTLDPNLPLLETRSYEDLYRYEAVEGPRIAVRLVGTMGAVGLLLAVSGLYGLVAYTVTRRTREIGIRMALGATGASVLRLVMGKGVMLVAAGTAIGLALGIGVERLMNALVFDAGGIDIVAYLIVVPTMLLVTLLAAYVPGRRASRLAPTQALRYE